MTVEYEDHAAVCGDVSWGMRGYLRVEVSYVDPNAKTHTTDRAGKDEPDGRAVVLIPAGRVHSLVSADSCPEQSKP